MSNLFWLTDAQMARLEPFFPKSHGKPRVDDRRVLSGIIFINRNGLRWCDAPREYGPPKTLYNRWKRWRAKGIFARILDGLASEAAVPKTVMIDATYLKAHRTATSLRSKRGGRRPKGPSDWLNKGWHEHQVACRRRCGRSSDPLLHDCGTGQRLHGCSRPAGQPAFRDWLLADRGSDADWFREALKGKGTRPCIPGRKSRGTPIRHDKRRYKRRNRIEIMFGRLKDWRCVATRYDRCPKVFLSAVALAATVMFWL